MTENYTNNEQEPQVLLDALQWHLDHGADEMLIDQPVDRTVIPNVADIVSKAPIPKVLIKTEEQQAASQIMGAAAAIVEAQKLASACDSLESLKQVIKGFDGLSVKKTATNVVFSDGNQDANIMVIGEAPEGEDDIQGLPFVGESGRLLDKILACIDLDRSSEEAEKSVYVSNILNWRPPGNRTPTQAEMDISLPFIERHIALKQPKILILCGGMTAKTLLKRTDTISKLRGGFHDYQCGERAIPAMVTYHPAYLLQTPAQKKAVWADILMFEEKMKEIQI